MAREVEERGEEEEEEEIPRKEHTPPHLIRPEPPIEAIISPFQKFIKTQGSSGVILPIVKQESPLLEGWDEVR